MKNQYNSTQGGGFGIFGILGFVLAIIMLAGLLKKSSIDTDEQVDLYAQQEAHFSTDFSEDRSVPKSEVADRPVRTYDTPNKRRAEVRTPNQPIALDNWILQFEDIAKTQAIAEGIPAGISLAMGVHIMQNGVSIQSKSEFINLVVGPLTHLKHNAPHQDRASYFKYSANSQKWADGLGASGRYSTRELKKIMQQYDLARLDRDVREHIIRTPSATERKAEYVANEVIDRSVEARRSSSDVRHPVGREARTSQWRDNYEEVVGEDVAKQKARQKLSSGKYITEEDMQALIEEVDAETDEVVENKLMFMGRKINRQHDEAGSVTDVTNKRNAQARGERYQEYVEKKRGGRD